MKLSPATTKCESCGHVFDTMDAVVVSKQIDAKTVRMLGYGWPRVRPVVSMTACSLGIQPASSRVGASP